MTRRESHIRSKVLTWVFLNLATLRACDRCEFYTCSKDEERYILSLRGVTDDITILSTCLNTALFTSTILIVVWFCRLFRAGFLPP